MSLSAVSFEHTPSLVDRARSIARRLGCHIAWARRAGPHVLIGIGEDEAFARLTPLGGNSVGLSFRGLMDAPDEGTDAEDESASRWAPMLLVDDLSDVVEHALIAEGALRPQASGM